MHYSRTGGDINVFYTAYKLLFLLWHTPLGVHNAKSRHHSREWTILSHMHRFIQGQFIEFQVLLNSIYPRNMKASR